MCIHFARTIKRQWSLICQDGSGGLFEGGLLKIIVLGWGLIQGEGFRGGPISRCKLIH